MKGSIINNLALSPRNVFNQFTQQTLNQNETILNSFLLFHHKTFNEIAEGHAPLKKEIYQGKSSIIPEQTTKKDNLQQVQAKKYFFQIYKRRHIIGEV